MTRAPGAPTKKKLVLGPNHRRVVSVMLRELEKAAESVGNWVGKERGILLDVADDLSPAQKHELRRLLEELRSEIRHTSREITVDTETQSPSRAILGILSTLIVTLEETDSARLRGYGHVTEEMKETLDPALGRLIAILERMMRVIGADPSQPGGSPA